MRFIFAAVLSTTLAFSSAYAATKNVAPLPAGNSAGTHQAALVGPSMFLVLLSAGIVIGGIALAVSNNASNGVTTPTTTSTSTSSLP